MCSKITPLIFFSRWCGCVAVLLRLLQYPFLGPPATRLAAALTCGSCQCQTSALHLTVQLQELETMGLGEGLHIYTPYTLLYVVFL